jgi:enoyl-CoA hydratase/carnithine racemase
VSTVVDAVSDDEVSNDLITTSTVAAGDAKVAMLTFNRPDQHNPIDKDTIKRLKELLTQLIEENEVRAVILTGQGKSFSSGGDLKGYQSLYRDVDRFKEFMADFDEVCRILETAPLVTVAMINGTCVAGGLELSLGCDFITIADHARVGDGHLRFAQLPGAGGSQRLTRAIGVQRAKLWLYTGRLFSAAAAVEAGLATFSAPLEELTDRTLELIDEITRLTPLGWQTMKKLVDTAQRTGLTEGLAQEHDTVFDYATSSHDATEGLLAFAERRPAKYLGR